MGDVGEYFKEHREWDRERKKRNLAKADPEGWHKHGEYHWSRDLLGHKLDYWPSRNKFMWKGKVHTGDVVGFIRNREKEHGKTTV